MAQLARKGDVNQVGGAIIRGASTVFCNSIPVGLHPSLITDHAPYGTPHPPHAAAQTTTASPTVFADGAPVLKVGSAQTCGHSVVMGSNNVFVA